MHQRHGPRGDRLWAESAKDAAQKLNQSASPSNPGRASPQEMFTNKKGPFRVLPFLQEGFMRVTPQNNLADRAVRVFFLTAATTTPPAPSRRSTRLREGRATRTAWCGRRRRRGGGGKVVLLPLLRPPLRPRNRASLSRSCRHRRPPLPLLPLHRPLPVHRRCRRPRLRHAATAAPLPQPSSNDDHNQGLLSFARRDVLLSVLATLNVIDSEREMRGVSEPGEPGGGGKQRAWHRGSGMQC